MELPKDRYSRKRRERAMRDTDVRATRDTRIGTIVKGSLGTTNTAVTFTGFFDSGLPSAPPTGPLREKLEKLIERLTFTHGGEQWTFDLLASYWNREAVWVGSKTDIVNSYHPERKLPGFGVTVYFDDPDMSEADILAELRVTVLALVDHEAHEFFKVDGQPLIDPHALRDSTPMTYSRRSQMIREREAELGPQMPVRVTKSPPPVQLSPPPTDREAYRSFNAGYFVTDEAWTIATDVLKDFKFDANTFGDKFTFAAVT